MLELDDSETPGISSVGILCMDGNTWFIRYLQLKDYENWELDEMQLVELLTLICDI